MPTSEQLARRSEAIAEHTRTIGIDPSHVSKVPANMQVAVFAGCLANGTMTVDQIPPKIAEKVSLTLLKESPWRQRDAAADRGTEVHALAESISNGEKIDIPTNLNDHIVAWERFRDDLQLEFILTEFTVYHPDYDYAGTGDFLAISRLHPEWGLIAGDYKTSESGIWPDIALQLAALRFAKFIARPDGTEDYETLKDIRTCIGVQITGNGYQVVPVQATKAHFDIFLSAINVARWKREFEQFALDKTLPFVNTKETA